MPTSSRWSDGISQMTLIDVCLWCVCHLWWISYESVEHYLWNIVCRPIPQVIPLMIYCFWLSSTPACYPPLSHHYVCLYLHFSSDSAPHPHALLQEHADTCQTPQYYIIHIWLVYLLEELAMLVCIECPLRRIYGIEDPCGNRGFPEMSSYIL